MVSTLLKHMEDWNLLINFAWPHQRLRIGYEIIQPTEEDNYITITFDIIFVSIQLNYI